MSNKKIYKGLNKRRKFCFRKFITVVLCMALIFGYAYKKIGVDGALKNLNLNEKMSFVIDKMYFWKDLNFSVFKPNFENNQNLDESVNKSSQNEDSQDDSSQNSQVAIVEGMDVYLIQVGSFDNNADLNNMQNKLSQNKIPSSILEVDGVNKVQAYISFKEEDMRTQLINVKKLIGDAFLTKLELPVLSLEYTSDYSYIKNISDYLNSLLKSYEEESKFLNENRTSFNKEEYEKILDKRKKILDKLNTEVKKIDYDELDSFKNNLLFYTSQIESNISNCKAKIYENNLYECESLLISSIQMYYEFINKIKVG